MKMIDEIMFGKNYPISKIERLDNKIILHIKSKIECCKCPKCHKESKEYHSTYTRLIQDTPLHNTTTYLKVTAYEFKCNNENCKVRTFAETLPFARKNKVKTDALIQFILSMSIFMSSTSAALVMSFLNVKVSADSIDDIIKKVQIIDKPDVEEIGIDDVAIRKGNTYATIIYDMSDHHMLALLEGRDAQSVKKWLQSHNKIKTIARDRASAYATAINEILPQCKQVADKFHLFQNLIEYLKDIFYDKLPKDIFIKNNKIINEKIEKIPIELTNIDNARLETLEYTNDIPLDENGNEIIFDKKRHDLDSKQYKEQERKRLEKQQRIINIRNKYKYCKKSDMKNIAKELNISIQTLNKYKNMTDEEISKIININSYKKRKSLIDNYVNIIFKMLKDGIEVNYIMAFVLKAGYKGTLQSLKMYIYLIAKNNNMKYEKLSLFSKFEYPRDITIIKRNELLKYILTIDEKKKDKTISKYINIIIEKYPLVREIMEIFLDFHEIMFSKDEELVEIFLEFYKEKIPTFCKGIRKDIAPVKNAISLTINSGFVEGNNNKFKLIKRILYGKSKLVNLSKRSYLFFLATSDNFSIEEIVETILDDKR